MAADTYTTRLFKPVVADPHQCDEDPDHSYRLGADADPDLSFHFDAASEPTFQYDADPDLAPHQNVHC